jgi:DNA polymerase III subunit chi
MFLHRIRTIEVTAIGFYHLLSTTLDRALPKLLERAWMQGHRILVRAGSAERVEQLDALLWTYEEASFLPHGSARDGNAAAQPIWLTHGSDNPNRASMLVLVDNVEAENLAFFGRCADLFDGNDEEAVAAARDRWRKAHQTGHALSYWQQTASGWEKRS